MRSLFLLGSPRSGSSVVAEMHAKCGFVASRDVHNPNLANPRGTFESLQVQEINEFLVASLTPPEQLLLKGQHWLAKLPPHIEYSSVEEVRFAIRAQLENPGCLKDPRFTWTLPTWLEEAPESPIVCTFRSPIATAQSIVRTCELYAPIDRPAVDLARAYELWISSYERVVDHLRARGHWHFMHLDQTFTKEGQDALQDFTGHELNRSIPIQELRASSSDQGAPQRARELYSELCQLASFSTKRSFQGVSLSAERSLTIEPRAPQVALVIPVLEGDRIHLSRLLPELSGQRGVDVEVFLIDQTTDGGIESDSACVIRETNPSRGLAYLRGLEQSSAPFIALQSPAVTSLPQRLARQAACLDRTPNAQLCTSDIALRNAVGEFERTVAVDLAGETPPAHWQSGAMLRREALGTIDQTPFVPSELALYRRLWDSNEVVHLAETLCTVTIDDFATRTAWDEHDSARLRLSKKPVGAELKVTVLMASHNRKGALTECLEALSRQLVAPGTFEVIVIDDGSKDGTQDLFRHMQLCVPLRFIEQENTGAASARNRGLPHARGELVLFINDDTILFPHTVRGHIEAHRELESQQAIVLGTFEQPAEECAKNMTRLLENSTMCFAYSLFSRASDVGGSSFYTCNLSLPRSAINECGVFDEEFPLFAEDTDYGMRLARLGYRIHYRPELRATHRHVLPFSKIHGRQLAVSKAHVRLYARHPEIIPELYLKSTIESMRVHLKSTRSAFDDVIEVVDNLSDVNLAHLETLSGSERAAQEISEAFTKLFPMLNRNFWTIGMVQEMDRIGVESFQRLATIASEEPETYATRIPVAEASNDN